MLRRRRFKQTKSLEERLSEEAKRPREEAKSLPPGRDAPTQSPPSRDRLTYERVAAIPRATTPEVDDERLSRLCCRPRWARAATSRILVRQ
jgi:hypothetical protein